MENLRDTLIKYSFYFNSRAPWKANTTIDTRPEWWWVGGDAVLVDSSSAWRLTSVTWGLRWPPGTNLLRTHPLITYFNYFSRYTLFLERISTDAVSNTWATRELLSLSPRRRCFLSPQHQQPVSHAIASSDIGTAAVCCNLTEQSINNIKSDWNVRQVVISSFAAGGSACAWLLLLGLAWGKLGGKSSQPIIPYLLHTGHPYRKISQPPYPSSQWHIPSKLSFSLLFLARQPSAACVFYIISGQTGWLLIPQ